MSIHLHRFLDILLDRFLPVFGTCDTSDGWNSQVCPCAIGGINTCHKMRHSMSLPTVTYICMGELTHFHHGPTTSFLHSHPIQTPPSGPGLNCAAVQVLISTCPACLERPHEEQANSAVEKQSANAVVRMVAG